MVKVTPFRRILAGLILVCAPVLCAFVQDPPPEPEAWICAPTKPRCIGLRAMSGLAEVDQ